jgi:hypothetical protein
MKMVNQLWSNVLWGQRGNFLSMPTDCPQRDERLGWMGDAKVFWRKASFNRLLLQTTYPSCGYMIEHGATTMWGTMEW